MKSKINTLADYKETPFERNITIRCPEEHIKKELHHLSRGFKKTEPVTVIEKGDVTVLALVSQVEKFNKPAVFVTVGGGLFDAGLEAALIGHTVGETFDAKAGDADVTITVKQATRTVFPEPTDEMAAAYAESHDEYAGITTVEEYRRRVVDDYIREQRGNTIYGAMDEVLGYVLTHSDWEFDESELTECVNEEKEFVKMQLKEEQGCDRDPDSLTDEEVKQFFGIPSREEMETMLRNGAEQRIATVLWCAAVDGKDAASYTIAELEEAMSWEFLETFVKESIDITEER